MKKTTITGMECKTRLTKTKLSFVIPLILAIPASAADVGSVRDGSWFVSTNWSPAGIPASGDNVFIAHDVSFDSSSAAQSITVGNLNLSSATLHTSGPATLTAGGSNSVFAGDNLLTGNHYNQGTIFQNGKVTIDPHSYFRNLAGAIYELQGGSSMFIHSEYYSFFENRGILRTSGAGTATITHNVNNLGGTVQVDSGTLCLQSAGTSSNGAFIVAAGATLDLTGGNSPTWFGTISGSGGGIVSLNSGGLRAWPQHLTLNLPDGLFQWTGGTFSDLITNLNTITTAGTGTVNENGVLYNHGLVRHTGAAHFIVHPYSYIRNMPDGIHEFAGDGSMHIHSDRMGQEWRRYDVKLAGCVTPVGHGLESLRHHPSCRTGLDARDEHGHAWQRRGNARAAAGRPAMFLPVAIALIWQRNARTNH
jgi:hypothetical protein